MSQPVLHPDGSSTGGVDLSARTLRLTGELDLATRFEINQACVIGGGDVIVDLSDVSFMDCSAYGGLMAAAADLRNVSGALSIVNTSGQPAFLLALIAEMFETKTDEVPETQPSGGAVWQS